MTQKNNKIKNLFSNVVYCVVLGVGLWAQNAVADVLVVRGVGSVMCPEGYTLTSVSSGTSDYSSCWGSPASGLIPMDTSGKSATKCEYWTGTPITDPNVIGFCAKNDSGEFLYTQAAYLSASVPNCPNGYIDTGGTPPMKGYVAEEVWQKRFCYKSCSGADQSFAVRPSGNYVSCPEGMVITSLVTPKIILTGMCPACSFNFGGFDYSKKQNQATTFVSHACAFNSTINPKSISCAQGSAPYVMCSGVIN